MYGCPPSGNFVRWLAKFDYQPIWAANEFAQGSAEATCRPRYAEAEAHIQNSRSDEVVCLEFARVGAVHFASHLNAPPSTCVLGFCTLLATALGSDRLWGLRAVHGQFCTHCALGFDIGTVHVGGGH